jgi:hypothetical protein
MSRTAVADEADGTLVRFTEVEQPSSILGKTPKRGLKGGKGRRCLSPLGGENKYGQAVVAQHRRSLDSVVTRPYRCELSSRDACGI